MVHSRLIIVSIVALALGTGAGYYFGYDIGYEKAIRASVDDFDDCAKAGYPNSRIFPGSM